MDRILDGDALQKFLDIDPWIQCPPISTSPPVLLGGRRSQRVAKRNRQNVFPFFLLPRELRNLVYDFTLSNDAFEFGHINMIFRASYTPFGVGRFSQPSTSKSKNTRKLPRWPPRFVIVSKQFLSEALAQFHHMAWFTPCAEPENLFTTARPAGSLRLDHAKHVDMSVLPKATSHRKIRVTPVNTQCANGHDRWFTELTKDFRLPFIQTLRHLSRSNALQILALHFDLRFPEAASMRVNQTDLTCIPKQFRPVSIAYLLAQLPKLGLVTVSLTCIGDWKVPLGWDAFVTAYTELEMVAKYLVPQPRPKAWEQRVVTKHGTVFWQYWITSAAHSRRRRMRGKHPWDGA